MPAYRSSAEADIRGPVVERLREIIPGCRIIHEINAASFGNRIDVMAVGTDRIATVEIKSERDKLDRLEMQIRAMRSVSNMVYAALHEKFLNPLHGGFYPPEGASGAITWIWPVADRDGYIECGSEWRERDWRKPLQCLPPAALGMLWRNEVHDICRALGVKGAGQLTMEEARDHIVWRMTGREITHAICRTLRARKCVEADPEIFENTR